MVQAILSLYGCASRKSSSSLTALLMYTADQQNVKQISDHLPGSHLGAEKQQDHRKEIFLVLITWMDYDMCFILDRQIDSYKIKA